MTSTLSDGDTNRVSHMPPMSSSVPTNGSATITVLIDSRTEANRKISPSRPAISVCPNRCVWLVWMSSGVRIQTLAALEISPSVISFSPLIWP